jgi:hypothetical protein
MFPPDLDTGHRHTRRVRRVGRRGRPLTLVLAVVLFAAFWTASAGTAVWGVTRGRTDGAAGAIAGVTFWTAVVALLLWRVWRGGPNATRFMARAGTAIGAVMLAGMVAFAVLMVAMPPGGSPLTDVVYFLPGVCAGAALFTAGVLLRRREVREWGGY